MTQYIWHDIVIVGDSFCMSRKSKTDWPQLVMSGLTGEPFEENRIPRGRGVAGGSWWKTRKILNQEAFGNGRPKLIIFCHTDSGRINHDGNEPYNAATMNSYPAVKSYYEELFSEDFHKWAKISWFREINARWSELSKLVHFHCFDEMLNPDESNVGPWGVEVDLNGLVYRNSLTSLVGTEALTNKEGRSNHMTIEQNRIFAENVIKIIQEDKVDNTIDIVNGGLLSERYDDGEMD